ncbi:MAG: hypothetical protein ACH350_08755 [Parachlamydiaceae bacterium]
MKIKVNNKMLSIPPYLSASWSQISALYMKGSVLVVTLNDGDALHIPDLSPETINLIYQNHASYMEKEESSPANEKEIPTVKNIMEPNNSSVRFALGTPIEGIGGMMQHNPSQADAPNLPPEILEKIGAISKIISPSEEMAIPQGVPGCNCFFCQIARTIHPESTLLQQENEWVIGDEDLHFQEWDIQQTDEKLYSVVNRLDKNEKYHVYLGQPIGCTCGKEGCEHVLAVLKS